MTLIREQCAAPSSPVSSESLHAHEDQDTGKSEEKQEEVTLPKALKKYFFLLPTKSAIQCMLASWEATHKSDMQKIKDSLQSFTTPTGSWNLWCPL